jgi:hypothetical protein
METKRQAEVAYRRAFQVFSEKAQQVQALTALSGQDPKAVETALIELQRAHNEYQERRDTWVKQLLGSSKGQAGSTTNPLPHSDDVRAIAELLWESAGRPEGTAAEDWRRAEEIIEKASTLAVA